MAQDKNGNWMPDPHNAHTYTDEEKEAAQRVMRDFNASARRPDKMGVEFNRVSRADYIKLDPRNRTQFDMIERQKEGRLAQTRADLARGHEQRIKTEIEKILRTPRPQLDGPPMTLGGTRANQARGVTREEISEEDFRNPRRLAEQRVNEWEKAELQRIERPFNQAQRDLLDHALGPNRYPSLGR